MCVFSYSFLQGAVSVHRDERLIAQVIQHVRAVAQPHLPVLFAAVQPRLLGRHRLSCSSIGTSCKSSSIACVSG